MNTKIYLRSIIVFLFCCGFAIGPLLFQISVSPTNVQAAQNPPLTTSKTYNVTSSNSTIYIPVLLQNYETPVQVTWWHISTGDDEKALWQTLANEYMATHPNVNIEISVMENTSFKSNLDAAMQAGNPPDIFQSWGGGVMSGYAKEGLLQDITPALDANGNSWRNTFASNALGLYAYQGKNYGVPWDMGMVGFWYNKELFSQAGIAIPPTTWTEFLNDVNTLKTAGITPIALGEGDKWTGAFWWEYLAIRIGGQAAFETAYNRTGSFTDPPFIQAGTTLQGLVNLLPFQNDFLNAPTGMRLHSWAMARRLWS